MSILLCIAWAAAGLIALYVFSRLLTRTGLIRGGGLDSPLHRHRVTRPDAYPCASLHWKLVDANQQVVNHLEKMNDTFWFFIPTETKQDIIQAMDKKGINYIAEYDELKKKVVELTDHLKSACS